MTIAEQLRKEGRQEGLQQGMQQGMEQGMQQEAAQTLLKILNKRFGAVSPSKRDQICKATTNELEVWIEASLDAATLDEIFRN